jgi:hypothetical protein
VRIRLLTLLLGVGLIAVACGAADDEASVPSGEESGVTALRDRFAPELAALIDPTLIRSGGPPPDGIPPLDDPVFVATSEVEALAPDEPVLALEVNGDSRAYPIRIMTWHEIVNDEVGGVPVTVSYCPLCNSALAYERQVGDHLLDFGTSGLLYQSSLVMYDRQTESLWTHFDGSAVIGELAGTELVTLPVTTVAWEIWSEANPDGLVLSEDTGFSRSYGRNPYVGYEDSDGLLSDRFRSANFDERLPAKQRVVGIEVGDQALAVLNDALQAEGVIAVEMADTSLVVWSLPGTSSALDGAEVSGGVDVGAVGVFVPEADGQTLTFRRVDGGFVDYQTQSTWDFFGRAVEGPLAGEQLEAVPHVDTFWFVWGTFAPQSEIVAGSAVDAG